MTDPGDPNGPDLRFWRGVGFTCLTGPLLWLLVGAVVLLVAWLR